MARIKLTEGELRNIIKKIINESSSSIRSKVYTDLTTDDGIEFTVQGIVEKYPREGEYTVEDNYDIDTEPQFRADVENYVNNNEELVKQALVDAADKNDEYAQSEHDEYNPEEQYQ
jgi:hypothetical protein